MRLKLTFLFILCISIGFSQKKLEKLVHKQTDELVKLLSLGADKKTELYSLLLERQKIRSNLKKKTGQEKKDYIEKIKAPLSELKTKIVTLIGSDKLDLYNQRLAEKRGIMSSKKRNTKNSRKNKKNNSSNDGEININSYLDLLE